MLPKMSDSASSFSFKEFLDKKNKNMVGFSCAFWVAVLSVPAGLIGGDALPASVASVLHRHLPLSSPRSFEERRTPQLKLNATGGGGRVLRDRDDGRLCDTHWQVHPERMALLTAHSPGPNPGMLSKRDSEPPRPFLFFLLATHIQRISVLVRGAGATRGDRDLPRRYLVFPAFFRVYSSAPTSEGNHRGLSAELTRGVAVSNLPLGRPRSSANPPDTTCASVVPLFRVLPWI